MLSLGWHLICLFFSDARTNNGFRLGSYIFNSTIHREKDKKNADNTAEHALAIAFFIASIFTLLGIIYGKDILLFLGAEGNILIIAWDYLSMIILGLPFMVFSGFLDLFSQEKVI